RASEYLSLSPKTVRRLVSEGKIPGYRVEGKILIPLAELESFVQKQPVEVVDIKGMADEIMKKIKSAGG
ncbi:MAG: helix-turn-helix domain-containing protein, partial [Candidatus Aenigmarchaeota archaeon]|nr:helix-turn-helix domain-containing protein [Candidatus Aenigmarchaeota archaeon]